MKKRNLSLNIKFINKNTKESMKKMIREALIEGAKRIMSDREKFQFK